MSRPYARRGSASRARSALVLAVTLVTSCTPARRTSGASSAPAPERVAAPAPRGTLFIVGGGSQSRELVQQFVSLAGGPRRARIAILPMASAEAAAGGREKADDLRGLGASAFVVNITRAQAESDSIARLLGTATGIWFGGGDQSRLTAVLAGTRALRVIQARYAAGAVVGGTSAGAAVMSDSMLTGNQRRPGVDTVGDFGDEYPRVARSAIQVVPGLGFLHGAIVDQHFLRRERANRLLSVVLERPSLIGVGIDERTALRVDPDGRWTVLGASAALVLDARRSEVTPATAPRLGASGVQLYLLPSGSRFDPHTGRATLPDG